VIQFAPDKRGADRQRIGIGNFSQRLGAAVDVPGIRGIFFSVAAFFAIEHAVRAYGDEACAVILRPRGETVRKYGVQLNARDWIEGGFAALSQCHAVDYYIRRSFVERTE